MRKYTIENIVDIINTEGLGYAILDYTDETRIEDEELLKLWRNAKIAMLDLQEYIESKMPEDFEWEQNVIFIKTLK